MVLGSVQFRDWLPHIGFAPVLLLAAVAYGSYRNRRDGTSRTSATLAALTLVVILAATLLRNPDTTGHWPGRDVLWWAHRNGMLRFSRREGVEFVLNVALFVPAGAAWGRITRRHPAIVVGALGALSFIIESLQSLFARGVPDARDWLANTAGAVIGTAIATLLRRLFDTCRPPRPGIACSALPSRPLGRRALVTSICVAAMIGASVLAVDAVVRFRQQRLHAELQSTFRGSDRLGVEHDLSSAGIRPVHGVLPNATVRTAGPTLTLRYSIQWMGSNACVFAIWAKNEAPVYQDATGHTCTDFIG